MVLLQTFIKNTDLISMVGKSTDSRKLLSICFYKNIEGFYVRLLLLNFFGKSRATKTKTNCATVASFPWPLLLSAIAVDQSVEKKSLSYCKV